MQKADHTQPFFSDSMGIKTGQEHKGRIEKCFQDSLQPDQSGNLTYRTSRFGEQLLNNMSRRELAYYATLHLQDQRKVKEQIEIKKSAILRRLDAYGPDDIPTEQVV